MCHGKFIECQHLPNHNNGPFIFYGLYLQKMKDWLPTGQEKEKSSILLEGKT